MTRASRIRPPCQLERLEDRSLLSLGLPGDGVLDLTIISDLYTDFVPFHADAAKAVESLFSVEPFKSRRSQFAIHVLENSTPLNSGGDPFGNVPGSITVDFDTAARVVSDSGIPTDFVLVIADLPYLAGVALEGGNVCAVTSAAANRTAVPHELAHVIGSLADEYMYSDTWEHPLDQMVHANLYAGDLPALAWSDLVAPDEYALGASNATNWYRASPLSIMNVFGGWGFNAVSLELVNDGLDYWASAIADSVSPLVSFASLQNGASVAGILQVAVNTTDNIGVTRTQLWVDGQLARNSTVAPFTLDWKTADVSLGSHRLQIKAFDAAGNVGLSQEITVNLTRGSNFEIRGPAPGTTLTLSEDARFDVAVAAWGGEIGELDIYVGDRLVVYQQVPRTLRLPVHRNHLLVGANTITVVALAADLTTELYRASIDVVRTDPAPIRAHWTDDSVFFDPLRGIVPLAVTVTSGQASKVELLIDGALYATDSVAPYQFTLDTRQFSNGIHDVQFVATNAFSHGNTDSSSFLVEFSNNPNAPLSIGIVAPAAKAVVRGAVAVGTKVNSGSVNSVKLYVDNKLVATSSLAPFAFTIDTRKWADGLRTLKLVANGPKGTSQATRQLRFANAIDRKAPTVVLTAPRNNARVRSPGISIVGTASDKVGVVRVELLINNQLVSTTQSPRFRFRNALAGLAKGRYTIRVRAFDAAGNVGQSKLIAVNKTA